jgi:tetratricopeptide (TPR) repeat protein
MLGRRLPHAVLILEIALGAVRTVSQTRQSDVAVLPALAIEALPPPVRAGFERAYDDARTHPDDPSAVGRLGMMLQAYEQYQSADACYRVARALDPRSLSWAYLSGVVRAELGAHTEALAAFRQALDIDPGYLPARMRLADTLMRAGDLDASRSAYEALTRDFPELALAHYGLGRVSAATHNSAAAVEHYRRAVDAAPQFGAAHYALALAYRDLSSSNPARPHLEAYRQFGARRPALPDRLLEAVRAMRETARDLISEAARVGASGRLDDAIALHLKAIEADPAAAQAHVNLISLYGRIGRVDKATEHYRAALTLEGTRAEAHYNYGVLLAGRADTGAADAFRKALEINPFHAQAHNNLAALLARDGDLEAAAAHYRQAIASDPQHRTARLNLGRVLVAMGRPREAIEHLLKTLLPDDVDAPRCMFALSHAYFSAGDHVNARKYGRDALDRAERLGQEELARMIQRELQRFPPAPR